MKSSTQGHGLCGEWHICETAKLYTILAHFWSLWQPHLELWKQALGHRQAPPDDLKGALQIAAGATMVLLEDRQQLTLNQQ